MTIPRERVALALGLACFVVGLLLFVLVGEVYWLALGIALLGTGVVMAFAARGGSS